MSGQLPLYSFETDQVLVSMRDRALAPNDSFVQACFCCGMTVLGWLTDRNGENLNPQLAPILDEGAIEVRWINPARVSVTLAADPTFRPATVEITPHSLNLTIPPSDNHISGFKSARLKFKPANSENGVSPQPLEAVVSFRSHSRGLPVGIQLSCTCNLPSPPGNLSGSNQRSQQALAARQLVEYLISLAPSRSLDVPIGSADKKAISANRDALIERLVSACETCAGELSEFDSRQLTDSLYSSMGIGEGARAVLNQTLRTLAPRLTDGSVPLVLPIKREALASEVHEQFGQLSFLDYSRELRQMIGAAGLDSASLPQDPRGFRLGVADLFVDSTHSGPLLTLMRSICDRFPQSTVFGFCEFALRGRESAEPDAVAGHSD